MQTPPPSPNTSQLKPPLLPKKHQVKKIVPFKGQLELPASAEETEADATMASALKTMNLVLDGYDYDVELLAQVRPGSDAHAVIIDV